MHLVTSSQNIHILKYLRNTNDSLGKKCQEFKILLRQVKYTE